MEKTTLHIKNMVCPRCIMAVKLILESQNIAYQSVLLGEVVLEKAISEEKHKVLEKDLLDLGFELLSSSKSVLISKIKTLIIDQIHFKEEPMDERYSTYLSRKLHLEYSYISHLFSSVEGLTIEKYILRQKVERVKELLFYKELTLSEIAHQLNYSSVAHLSAQFKKETGMTPTAFRKLGRPDHRALDI